MSAEVEAILEKVRAQFAPDNEPYGDPQLDANQQGAFERALQGLAAYPADPELIAEAAAEAVRATIPTARDAARAIAAMRSDPTYCYLAFHGVGGVASFLKVGISRHPERRLYGMATDNPLDCLWAFVTKLPSGPRAYHVEQTLLRHMAAHKKHGEWLTVGRTDEHAAFALARQLSEVARGAEADACEFVPIQGGRNAH